MVLRAAFGAAFIGLASAILSPSAALAQEANGQANDVADPPSATSPSAGRPQSAGPPFTGGSRPKSVFDGDWISLGIGLGLSPSYDGSNDYTVFPLPVIRGELGGVGIAPRPAGLALDFIKDAPRAKVKFAIGPALRVRSDRVNNIQDDVVEAAGRLDRAVEIGPSLGVSFGGLISPVDSLTISSDVRWDIAGAHEGMVVEPSITYFRPVTRATAVSLSLSTSWVDDSFADTYYSVSPAQSAASGLDEFTADGGFNSAGVNMLIAHDFDGNVLNGGLGAVIIAGYSRQLGDARRTPFTSERGSANQWLIGAGIAYTF